MASRATLQSVRSHGLVDRQLLRARTVSHLFTSERSGLAQFLPREQRCIDAAGFTRQSPSLETLPGARKRARGPRSSPNRRSESTGVPRSFHRPVSRALSPYFTYKTMPCVCLASQPPANRQSGERAETAAGQSPTQRSLCSNLREASPLNTQDYSKRPFGWITEPRPSWLGGPVRRWAQTAAPSTHFVRGAVPTAETGFHT